MLHIAFFGAVTFAHWPAWLTGALRDPASTGVAADASLAGFWALPGGFALPMIALGLMIISSARQHRRVPGYVALLLTVWTAIASFILTFSGLLLGIIPALMLIAAGRLFRWSDETSRVACRPRSNRTLGRLPRPTSVTS